MARFVVFRGARDLLVAGCECAVAALIALAAALAAAVEVAAAAAVAAAAELAVALLGVRFASHSAAHSAVHSAVHSFVRSAVHYVAAGPHFAVGSAVRHHVKRDCGNFRFVRLILARDSGARAAERLAHLH